MAGTDADPGTFTSPELCVTVYTDALLFDEIPWVNDTIGAWPGGGQSGCLPEPIGGDTLAGTGFRAERILRVRIRNWDRGGKLQEIGKW